MHKMKSGLDSPNITFLSLLQIWIANYCAYISSDTYQTYCYYLYLIEGHYIGNILLPQLTTNDFRAFIDYLKKKDGITVQTIRSIFYIIRSAMKKAIDNCLIGFDVSQYSKFPIPKGHQRLLSDSYNCSSENEVSDDDKKT